MICQIGDATGEVNSILSQMLKTASSRKNSIFTNLLFLLPYNFLLRNDESVATSDLE